MSPRIRQPIRVLIVEDAMDHALMLRTLLKGSGDFLTFHAQDGSHAIRLLDEREFDLVITDLNLPAADGFEVIAHVKARHPALPILVVTGYTNPQYRDQAFRAGADDVLMKPLDRDDLLHKVEEVMGKVRVGAVEDGRGGGVLALGARAGDVELGCGGTLLKHRARGEEVLVVVVDPDREADDAARAAAERMGARIISSRSAVGEEHGIGEVAGMVRRIVRELEPTTVYLPALPDAEDDRRRLHQEVGPTLAGVPRVRAYVTATTHVGFRPDHLEDVEEVLTDKLDLLSCYRETGRRELSGRFARALARYWGRFADFGEVEPFADVAITSGAPGGGSAGASAGSGKAPDRDEDTPGGRPS